MGFDSRNCALPPGSFQVSREWLEGWFTCGWQPGLCYDSRTFLTRISTMSLRVPIIFLMALWWPWFALAEQGDEAREPVDQLNTVLIEVMKGGKEMGYQGRYARLDPVVKRTFHFEAVSLVALGSHWKKLEDDQKRIFMTTLTELSVATYAAQFKAFDGERFEYDSTREIKNGRYLVRYNLVAPKEAPVKFEYVVAPFGDQWQIINIVVDGISDLALKKAQYTSVIDREGFDALIAKLNEKITNYAKSND
jgi:phospholipid transport system substrate-binding protein